MDISEIFENIVVYLQNNIYVSLGLGLVFLLLIFRKPKLFITIFVIAFLIFGIFSMLSDVSETGDEHRSEMSNGKVLKD